MIYFYFYEMKWYTKFEDKEVPVCGGLFAESYSDACEKLAGCYGEDAIFDLRLTISEIDGDIIEVCEDDFDAFKKMVQ